MSEQQSDSPTESRSRSDVDSNTAESTSDAFRMGFAVDRESRDRLDAALSAACDYRGDVTLTLRDGRVLEGFVFDRRRPHGDRPAAVRLLPTDGGERITVDESEIERLEVTGKDTAAGKSFENWIRRYAEKKLAGQAANIESEPLDE